MHTDHEFLKALDQKRASYFLDWLLAYALKRGKKELEKLSVFEVVQIYLDQKNSAH